MYSMKAEDIIQQMEALRDDAQREVLMRFFKTAPGEYGAGDEFLGIRNPTVRLVVKEYALLPPDELPSLLRHSWHEVRLCGYLILLARYLRLASPRLRDDSSAIALRDDIIRFYLSHLDGMNNWDLVDLSSPKMLGHWLLAPSEWMPTAEHKRQLLDEMAADGILWHQRMVMVSTWYPSRMADPSWALRYARRFLHHPHDLMHKATGWMLREMGKTCPEMLAAFLERHADIMPRTMLRYAIEKLPERERRYWMEHGRKRHAPTL